MRSVDLLGAVREPGSHLSYGGASNAQQWETPEKKAAREAVGKLSIQYQRALQKVANDVRRAFLYETEDKLNTAIRNARTMRDLVLPAHILENRPLGVEVEVPKHLNSLQKFKIHKAETDFLKELEEAEEELTEEMEVDQWPRPEEEAVIQETGMEENQWPAQETAVKQEAEMQVNQWPESESTGGSRSAVTVSTTGHQWVETAPTADAWGLTTETEGNEWAATETGQNQWTGEAETGGENEWGIPGEEQGTYEEEAAAEWDKNNNDYEEAEKGDEMEIEEGIDWRHNPEEFSDYESNASLVDGEENDVQETSETAQHAEKADAKTESQHEQLKSLPKVPVGTLKFPAHARVAPEIRENPELMQKTLDKMEKRHYLQESKWGKDWSHIVNVSKHYNPNSKAIPPEEETDPFKRYRRRMVDFQIQEAKNRNMQFQVDCNTARMKSGDRRNIRPVEEPMVLKGMRRKAISAASMLTDFLGSSFADVEEALTGIRPKQRLASSVIPPKNLMSFKELKSKGLLMENILWEEMCRKLCYRIGQKEWNKMKAEDPELQRKCTLPMEGYAVRGKKNQKPPEWYNTVFGQSKPGSASTSTPAGSLGEFSVVETKQAAEMKRLAKVMNRIMNKNQEWNKNQKDVGSAFDNPDEWASDEDEESEEVDLNGQDGAAAERKNAAAAADGGEGPAAAVDNGEKKVKR